MDIGILDFGGNFAGAALGLLAHGHEVSYFRTGPREPQESLLARLGWEVQEPHFRADLVIIAAPFADEAWAYELGIQREAPLAPEDPWFFSINPLQRRVRDRWLEPRLREIEHRLVVVDTSDCGEMCDEFFACHGNWKFKRELPAYGFGIDIHPFPFLYNPTLLSMEWSVGLDRLSLPLEARQSKNEILFAGTVDHWRYFGRRRLLIHRFVQSHPDYALRIVTNGMTSMDVWQALQVSRAGFYMHGRGEMCFRLHECAAFGVPIVAGEEFTIQVPAAWKRMFPTDPADMRSSSEMLAFYHKHYHPIRAAQLLLDRIGMPSTGIAPESGFLDRSGRQAGDSGKPGGESMVTFDGEDRGFDDVELEIVDDLESWGLSDFLSS